MLTREENELLTRVGPGTPAGEMLRRYWLPIAFINELKGKPLRRRILGEDLVLFRDEQNRLGLLALRWNSVISRVAGCAAATMAGFTTSMGEFWKRRVSPPTVPSDNVFVTRPTRLKSWAGSFLPILARSLPRCRRDSMCW